MVPTVKHVRPSVLLWRGTRNQCVGLKGDSTIKKTAPFLLYQNVKVTSMAKYLAKSKLNKAYLPPFKEIGWEMSNLQYYHNNDTNKNDWKKARHNSTVYDNCAYSMLKIIALQIAVESLNLIDWLYLTGGDLVLRLITVIMPKNLVTTKYNSVFGHKK